MTGQIWRNHGDGHRLRGQDTIRRASRSRLEGRRGRDYPPRQGGRPPDSRGRTTARRGPPERGGPAPAAGANSTTIEGQAHRSGGASSHRTRPTMTAAFVADASVAIGWVHPAQVT